MLRELRIENFALIEQVSLTFDNGLTALTGETGAGKSIIVEALMLALGARADASIVRAGEASARVDCVFDIDEEIAGIVAGLGHDAGDLSLVLSRQVSADGRSRCWINGRPATVGALAEIGDHLVDFHGQHEHQQLFRSQTHLRYLDLFGGDPIAAAREDFLRARQVFLDAARRLADAQNTADEVAERIEKDRRDLARLKSAALTEADEDELLALERTKLRNVSKLTEAVSAALAALEGGDDSAGYGGVVALGAVNSIISAERALRAVSELDTELEAAQSALTGLAIDVEEISRSLHRYISGLSFSAERLEEVDDRLALLKELKEEFGPSLAEVITRRNDLASRLSGASDPGALVSEFARQKADAAKDLQSAAARLSSLRREAAAALAAEVTSRLEELALPGARFAVRHTESTFDEGRVEVSANGLDDIEFVVALNPGEPEMPLAKVASGGEASRLMLAIKLALGGTDPVPLLVFDEIDAGIGGRTASAIGAKLKALARGQQVICITHLPQIAACAAAQVHVGKAVQHGRTVTLAVRLSTEERIDEVVRMLGGSAESGATRAHAKELLEVAQNEETISI